MSPRIGKYLEQQPISSIDVFPIIDLAKWFAIPVAINKIVEYFAYGCKVYLHSRKPTRWNWSNNEMRKI